MGSEKSIAKIAAIYHDMTPEPKRKKYTCEREMKGDIIKLNLSNALRPLPHVVYRPRI